MISLKVGVNGARGGVVYLFLCPFDVGFVPGFRTELLLKILGILSKIMPSARQATPFCRSEE